MADRREFLGSLIAAGAAARVDGLMEPSSSPDPGASGVTWLKRIRGKHRAVFDSPRDDVTGILRAWIWLNQCRGLLGARDKDCTAVVVLRHAGATLAMNDAFWDRYEVPLTGSTPEKPNIPRRNPQMTGVLKELPGTLPTPARPWAQGVGLDALIDRGGIVVVCGFAFWYVMSRVMTHDKVDEDRARAVAESHLVPGISIAPSGFFALAAAQEHGCGFVTNV